MALQPTTLSGRPLGARETLWLAGSFVLAGAPHLERLPLWIAGLVLVLVAWRLLLSRLQQSTPNRWLVGFVALATAAGVLLQYRTLFGREAGVALLLIMLALKLLETRTRRDGMLLGFLGCFLLVTNFLYSQTIATGAYMLACAWLLLATLISLQYVASWPGWRHPVQRAGVLLLQSVPLMLVLFVLFPRVQGPLWGLPQDAYAGLSGLSDNMSPGSLNSLILSDGIAFRAAFRGPIPEPRKLYWRGPVLWDFDGRTWTAPRFTYNTFELPASVDPIEYTVTLEPHNKRWLFALEFPGRRPPRSIATRDMQLLSAAPVRARIRYDMVSSTGVSYGLDDNESILQRSLQLPQGSSPRTLAYGQQLRRQYPDDRRLVAAVLELFRRENFFYTLSPPLLGAQPVDEFLFGTRQGFCEHYASAFTVLMRAAGIPARVVTGYLGGEVNPVGEYILVRQADAHAWTEIWLADAGWTRIDPTAAVSPSRVERGIASALPATDPLPLFVRGNVEWMQQLRLTWDSVTYSWNQWVLGYTPERQRLFLTQIGFSEATWQNLAVLLLVCAGVVMLLGTLLALRGLRAARRDPLRAAYERFCAKLARRGVRRGRSEGPVDFAARAAQAAPQAAAAITDITRRYVSLRYGRDAAAGALAELQRRIAAFTP